MRFQPAGNVTPDDNWVFAKSDRTINRPEASRYTLATGPFAGAAVRRRIRSRAVVLFDTFTLALTQIVESAVGSSAYANAVWETGLPFALGAAEAPVDTSCVILVTLDQPARPPEKSSAKTAAITDMGSDVTMFPSLPTSSSASTE